MMDAEAIAKGLSEAQRRAVSGDPDNVKLRGYSTVSALDMGIVNYVPVDKMRSRLALTPLGLAVRALLKGE